MEKNVWTIALQADLRYPPTFSACAPKKFQPEATVLLVKIVRDSFTNSQRKPSFGVKIVLSGFKDAQWRISAEKAWKELFLHLTLLNMYL